MSLQRLHLVGRAKQRFGSRLVVGQALPHHQCRERGDYLCPDMVQEWRKPFRPDYFPNDWLVGCPVCKTVQWRFGRWRQAWTLRQFAYASMPPACPLAIRDDLIMLTEGRYPDEICPWTFSEESQVPIDKYGNAEIYLTCTWGDAPGGYRVGLRSNGQYWMGTGRKERKSMHQAALSCNRDDHVLVGGLGLGLIVLELCQRNPASITIFEIDSDIAALIWPKVSFWCRNQWPEVSLKLVINDLRQATGQWDFVFIDIWDTANRRPETIALVSEMQQRAQHWINNEGRVICWQEERILPQADEKKIGYML